MSVREIEREWREVRWLSARECVYACVYARECPLRVDG